MAKSLFFFLSSDVKIVCMWYKHPKMRQAKSFAVEIAIQLSLNWFVDGWNSVDLMLPCILYYICAMRWYTCASPNMGHVCKRQTSHAIWLNTFSSKTNTLLHPKNWNLHSDNIMLCSKFARFAIVSFLAHIWNNISLIKCNTQEAFNENSSHEH